MLAHYAHTALRQFRRHKVTTAINVVCLAVGLLCFLTVYGVTLYLTNTDAHSPNIARIVAITQKTSIPGARSAIPEAPVTALPVARHLRADFPELAAVAREGNSHEVAVTSGATKVHVLARYADLELFDIFAWRLLVGDASQALRQPRSVVLSEATAVQLFGSAQRALGRSLLLYGRVDATVTGVLGTIAQPAHASTERSAGAQQRVDMYVSIDVIEGSALGQRLLVNWNSPTTSTFALLPADGSLTIAALRERLAAFDEHHIPAGEWQSEFGAVPASTYMATMLDVLAGTARTGVSSVTLFHILGALVLLVACINYANLASAQAATRSREFGLRRVVGALRGQLILQHLFEAALLSVVALLVALLLLVGALLLFPSPIAAFIAGVVLSSPSLWLGAAGLLFVVAVAAGAYPALMLSRVRAIEAVRSAKTTPRSRLAVLLVCCQFAAASFLLIAIMVMAAQNSKVRQSAFAALGDPIIVMNDVSAAGVDFATLRNELMRQPHVKAVSGSYVRLWGTGGAIASLSTSPDPQAERRMVSQERVQHDFFSTLEFQILAGREFDREHASDATQGVVIDRALALQNGWTPQQAIGQPLYQWIPGEELVAATPYRVVGVVENKTTRILGLGATSNVFFLRPQIATTAIIRIDRTNVAAALQEIDAAWSRLAPQVAIKRDFADELLKNSLATFQLMNSVFSGVAGLSLLIAVLGLIGMSMHMIGRRAHEIGVRKTLGSSASGVILMLLKDFSRPIVIANVIAWPLAFISMQSYLSIFTQRVGLSWTPFVVSLAITLFVAWLAVTAQAVRAARVQPAQVLRYE